jgi:hypothetical protein
MTDKELARRRRKADNVAFVNRVAEGVGISAKQARQALHWWLDQLEPLSEKERDELVANIPVLNHMLDRRGLTYAGLFRA